MSEFTEQWTEKTFTDEYGVSLLITRSDSGDINLVIDDREFSIPFTKVTDVANAMTTISNG